MIEVLAFPLLLIAASLAPKRKGNDKKTIQTIFENTGFAVRTKGGEIEYPQYQKVVSIKEGEEVIGLRYVYSTPPGLQATRITQDEKEMILFSDGLNRPVTVEFRVISEDDPKKYLVISVYNKDIPTTYPYEKIPNVEGWKMPLGKTLEEVIWVDFEKIPHMTIAGVTRFGKTVFLKVLMTYIIEHHPDDVEFYIIDLKGGLEFSEYEVLRQVKGVAGDYIETFLMVYHLHFLMHKDLEFFKANRIRNVVDSKINRRRFIIVDEAAQLASEGFMTRSLKDIPEIEAYLQFLPEDMQKKGKLKDLLHYIQYLLSEIARLGGGLGYRLIYCTQYPTADTLPRQIKMNADSKVTFRLPTGYASEVAIDMKGAEKLPSDVQGRALYKTHNLQQMQVPYLTDEDMWKRLEKYQVPQLREGESENVILHEQERNSPGGNFEHPGPPAVRHTGTNSKNPRFRNEP